MHGKSCINAKNPIPMKKIFQLLLVLCLPALMNGCPESFISVTMLTVN